MNTGKSGCRFLLWFGITIFTCSGQAALLPNAVLSFDAGVAGNSQSVVPASGSYFGVQVSRSQIIYTTISPFNGLRLGSAQPASGSHTGSPDGSERPNIDQPWVYFSNTGMHESSTPVTILSDNNAGNVTLDFTGWGFAWNGIPRVSLGGNPQFPGDTGIATMTCGASCETGDSFVLDYSARIFDLSGNPSSGFNATPYFLHLEGTISTVPVPAAIWLFGTGLAGLVGVARRKRVR